MTPSVLITEVCHYCRKGKSPNAMIPLPGGIKLCDGCYRRHQEGVLAMSGLKANSDGTFSSTAPPPPECSECGLSVQELRARAVHAGGFELVLAVHFENGIYRVMCPDCDKTYVPKRRDLYGDTQFGHDQKLK